jgi:hypothetical protein
LLTLFRPPLSVQRPLSHPTSSHWLLESGAEATAVQTLARLLIVAKTREASGLRRVHRRFQERTDLHEFNL